MGKRTYLYAQVAPELKKEFRKLCLDEGKTMQTKILELVAWYVDNAFHGGEA